MLERPKAIRDFFQLLPGRNAHDIADYIYNTTGNDLSNMAKSVSYARKMVKELEKEFGVKGSVAGNNVIRNPAETYSLLTGSDHPKKVYVVTFDFLIGFYLSDECFKDGQFGAASYPSGNLSSFVSDMYKRRGMPSNGFKVQLGTGKEALATSHERRHLMDNILNDHKMNHFTDTAAGIYTEDIQSLQSYLNTDYERTMRNDCGRRIANEIKSFPKASVKNLVRKGFDSVLLSYVVSTTEPDEMFNSIVTLDKSYNPAMHPKGNGRASA